MDRGGCGLLGSPQTPPAQELPSGSNLQPHRELRSLATPGKVWEGLGLPIWQSSTERGKACPVRPLYCEVRREMPPTHSAAVQTSQVPGSEALGCRCRQETSLASAASMLLHRHPSTLRLAFSRWAPGQETGGRRKVRALRVPRDSTGDGSPGAQVYRWHSALRSHVCGTRPGLSISWTGPQRGDLTTPPSPSWVPKLREL